ncbi:hypothetical protein SISSUDRAFT_1065814 [Sistotremastrum suecicum HHB10207 ss-3]|uniref:Uncharacterized protein n=1 Tax=Sistotremastrum suecicum HHB10207 ss-3 TaxID=1314776 RepID=A0A165Z1T9_9AGAM|nr:hypothetical protein SISSUDRAFT_1065814 [Sistotremastrum suecicum HHB10207 ss-3]
MDVPQDASQSLFDHEMQDPGESQNEISGMSVDIGSINFAPELRRPGPHLGLQLPSASLSHSNPTSPSPFHLPDLSGSGEIFGTPPSSNPSPLPHVRPVPDYFYSSPASNGYATPSSDAGSLSRSSSFGVSSRPPTRRGSSVPYQTPYASLRPAKQLRRSIDARVDFGNQGYEHFQRLLESQTECLLQGMANMLMPREPPPPPTTTLTPAPAPTAAAAPAIAPPPPPETWFRQKWTRHPREEFPPNFKFYTEQEWDDYCKEQNCNSSVSSSEKTGSRGKLVTRPFLLKRDGTVISDRTMGHIMKVSHAVLLSIKNIEAAYGRKMPATWRDAHHNMREHYFNSMGDAFEELTFAEDDWKMEKVVMSHYSYWVNRKEEGERVNRKEEGEQVAETEASDAQSVHSKRGRSQSRQSRKRSRTDSSQPPNMATPSSCPPLHPVRVEGENLPIPPDSAISHLPGLSQQPLSSSASINLPAANIDHTPSDQLPSAPQEFVSPFVPLPPSFETTSNHDIDMNSSPPLRTTAPPPVFITTPFGTTRVQRSSPIDFPQDDMVPPPSPFLLNPPSDGQPSSPLTSASSLPSTNTDDMLAIFPTPYPIIPVDPEIIKLFPSNPFPLPSVEAMPVTAAKTSRGGKLKDLSIIPSNYGFKNLYTAQYIVQHGVIPAVVFDQQWHQVPQPIRDAWKIIAKDRSRRGKGKDDRIRVDNNMHIG